jgi:hypothetical protein
VTDAITIMIVITIGMTCDLSVWPVIAVAIRVTASNLTPTLLFLPVFLDHRLFDVVVEFFEFFLDRFVEFALLPLAGALGALASVMVMIVVMVVMGSGVIVMTIVIPVLPMPVTIAVRVVGASSPLRRR